MIKKDEIAYLLLRLTLGANIFLHGFSRLIGDHAVFAAYMDKQMRNAPLPGFLVHFVGVVLPWCEGTVGLLMIFGLWTSGALIAGSLLMLTLQIGTCLAQNWDVAGAQLIYVLLYFILLTYSGWNRWSVTTLPLPPTWTRRCATLPCRDSWYTSSPLSCRGAREP